MSHAPESQPPEPSATDGTASGLENTKSEIGSKISRSAIIGAIFLMATSAIGPGFITQTATFTAQMGAAFAFAIFASILIDIAIQLNIWRMVTSSGKRAAQLASSAVPGSGILLSILIVVGGLAFNIGNIAGGGLGLNALLGIDPKLGGLLTGVLAIGIFLFKRAGKVVDAVVLVLGVVFVLEERELVLVRRLVQGRFLGRLTFPCPGRPRHVRRTRKHATNPVGTHVPPGFAGEGAGHERTGGDRRHRRVRVLLVPGRRDGGHGRDSLRRSQ